MKGTARASENRDRVIGPGRQSALHPADGPAKSKSIVVVLGRDEHRHTGQPCGNSCMQVGVHEMGVHDIRAFPAKPGPEAEDQHRVDVWTEREPIDAGLPRLEAQSAYARSRGSDPSLSMRRTGVIRLRSNVVRSWRK